MNIPSKLISDAVEALSSLPGVGEKTALRLCLHLLKRPEEEVEGFCRSIFKMKAETGFFKKFHNISDQEICNICNNPLRQQHLICVVEDIKDVMAIENTMEFNGTYHVLGGIISPIDGIGPGDINIASLFQRINNADIRELIFALNPSIEGDTTTYYISRQIKDRPIKVSSLARGIAFGGELEYTDEFTLAKSIL
ncbi:MAG TPA: recombination protein RecR, partial [Bacteroidetes bacterium]|nr:recombination protein RecR [Bacteroidota bacterium]